MLVVGGLHVLDGTLTVGGLLVVIAYLGAVYSPLSSIAHTTGSLQQARVSARRVREMFALTPETLDARGRRRRLRHCRGRAVRARAASPTTTAARSCTTSASQARPGEMVALVGLTGAGKTTLVSLIPRFFEPDAAAACSIDGVDVAEYALRSLRERIALVPQEPVLFSGTIADNIRYGRLDATDEEVEAAARAAHAHEFVSRLPKGYDTPVAEAGGDAVGRRAPAAGHRARDPEGRADPDPRRADLVARRHLRGDRVRGAAPAARRPHDDRHRAPAVDDPRRQPHPGATTAG